MQYAVTITRFNGENDFDGSVIVTNYVSADQAIEIMLSVSTLKTEQKTVEITSTPAPLEPVTPPVAAQPRAKTAGASATTSSKSKYDPAAMEADIMDGMKTSDIAKKYGVSSAAVSVRKSKLKAAGRISSRGPTLAERKQLMDKAVTPAQQKEIQELRVQGKTTTEISAMLELPFDDVAKVMAPGASTMTEPKVGPKVTSQAEPEWYQTEILGMLQDGIHEHDIYKRMIANITMAQFREAMEWAKGQLDQ